MQEWYSQFITNLQSLTWSIRTSGNGFVAQMNRIVPELFDPTPDKVTGYFIFWLLFGLLVFKITISLFNKLRSI